MQDRLTMPVYFFSCLQAEKIPTYFFDKTHPSVYIRTFSKLNYHIRFLQTAIYQTVYLNTVTGKQITQGQAQQTILMRLLTVL